MDRGDIRSRQTQSVVRSVCPIVKPKCVPAENEDLFVPFSDHRVRRNIPGFLERALATSRDKALVARREHSRAACAVLGEGLGREREGEVGGQVGLSPFQILILQCVFMITPF